jgi:hypothetical protein
VQLRPSSSELSEPADITAWPRGFAAIWNELFPAEQARIVQLLVERVDVRKDALEMRIRAEGLASIIGELRHQGEWKGGMVSSVDTRLDGSTLSVRIPMRFQRRGAASGSSRPTAARSC